MRIDLLQSWIRLARNNRAFRYYDIMLMHREISALMAADDVISYDHLSICAPKYQIPKKLQCRIDRKISSS
jgi:hypothetical protein